MIRPLFNKYEDEFVEEENNQELTQNKAALGLIKSINGFLANVGRDPITNEEIFIIQFDDENFNQAHPMTFDELVQYAKSNEEARYINKLKKFDF